MTVRSRRATLFLCSVAVAVLATAAMAKPVHHRHRMATATQTAVQPQQLGADRDMRYAINANQTPAATRTATA